MLAAAFAYAADAVVPPPQQQQGQVQLVSESEQPFAVVEPVGLA